MHIGYCIGTDYRKTNLIECENGEGERAEIDDMIARNNQGEGKCFNITDEVARSIAVEIQRRHDPSVFRSAYNYITGYVKDSVEGPINHT